MSTISGPQIISGGKLKIPSGKLSIVTPVIPTPPFTNSYSLLFDGADDYIDGFGNCITGTFSVSFWAKVPSSDFNGYRFPFCSTAGGIMVWFHYDLSPGGRYIEASCHSSFLGSFGNHHGAYEAGVNDIIPDEWFLFTMTWDGTTLNAYKNDDFIVEDQTSGVATPTDEPMFISTLSPYGYYYKGYLDEFALWDAELSPDAVTAIYNSGTPIDLASNSGNYTNSGDLVRYYRFEEGSGEAIDTTGTDEGDITGATYTSTVPS